MNPQDVTALVLRSLRFVFVYNVGTIELYTDGFHRAFVSSDGWVNGIPLADYLDTLR